MNPTDVRRALLAHHGLLADRPETGDAAVRAVLHDLRMIQLDPLDPIGTNADLVVAARTTDTVKDQVYDALLPGHAFEHFAKERCLLPAHAFPAWRDRAVQAPWWRLTERLKRVDEALIDAVLAEVTERGPLTAADLSDQGRVTPIDWSGWKGTSKAATLALEVLWTRCRVVVTARRGRNKVYDIPERALPDHHGAEAPDRPEVWRLLERIEAAGLLPWSIGPWWSGLRHVRESIDDLIAENLVMRVQLDGSRRTWLAPADLFDRPIPEDDGRMRILGPLDPVLWDRKLVQELFGFRYVWEVYKPAAKREWGWYVCPLLHHGQLVGRIEARSDETHLRTLNLWDEGDLDRSALRAALERHARFCAVELDT